MSAGGEVSRALAPEAVARGAVVIDNSSAFRMNLTPPVIRDKPGSQSPALG